MKKIKSVFLILISCIVFLTISCSKDEIEDKGLQTTIKGHVSDNIRGTNISGYKIVFIKGWSSCSNWMCGITSKEIATVYTDDNGDYSITFNYKLNEGEWYGFEEQYYGSPYYPEYLPGTGIIAGQTNVHNINAWKPIALNLNLEILNNNNPSLNIGNTTVDNNEFLFNTEFIYEQDITKTYYLRSRPDTDIKIVFWYYTGTNPVPVKHQKTILYHTTLDDVNTLNYTIDCSTF